MKNIVFVLILLASQKAHSQEINERVNRIEFCVLPALFYNYAHLGFSTQKFRNEHVIYFSSYYWGFPPSFNLNVSYNYNRMFKKEYLYIPYWFRASNTRRIIAYEEGYFPHTLRFSVGSGIGTHLDLKKRFRIRAEIGLGISVNLTNGKGNMFPYRLDLSNYSFDQKYPEYNPHVIPAARLKIGLSIALGKIL